MTTSLILPTWFDLHVHLRQDEMLRPVIADHLAAGCAGVLAMPNTKPPVAKIFESDPLPFMSIEAYRQQIQTNGGDQFQEILIPLYLTKESTATMITALTAATVTPQHLLYTIGDLLKGLKYHLYCLPLLKFKKDRASLRAAVTDPHNQQFFAGTDSAPHTQKTTDCGCAAGCYTAPIGPQLYAEAFELAGVDLSQKNNQAIFKRFLCELGSQFYNLPIPSKTFILEKSPQALEHTSTPNGFLTPLSLGLPANRIDWQIRKST